MLPAARMGTNGPALKCPLPVQSRSTPHSGSLRSLKSCRPHLAPGGVATRDSGLAGDRVEEMRMVSVAPASRDGHPVTKTSRTRRRRGSWV